MPGPTLPSTQRLPFGCAVGVGRLARDPGGRLRQLGDSVRDAVLPERGESSSPNVLVSMASTPASK